MLAPLDSKKRSMTIAAILALAVVAFAAGAYAYLVYSPKPQMPSLSTEVQHATTRVGDPNSIKWPISKASLCSTLTAISTTGTTVGRMRRSQ
jgi:hypothetical protein